MSFRKIQTIYHCLIFHLFLMGAYSSPQILTWHVSNGVDITLFPILSVEQVSMFLDVCHSSLHWVFDLVCWTICLNSAWRQIMCLIMRYYSVQKMNALCKLGGGRDEKIQRHDAEGTVGCLFLFLTLGWNVTLGLVYISLRFFCWISSFDYFYCIAAW